MGQIEYFLKNSENNELHGHFNLVEYVNIIYKPLPDITAYELAKLLEIFIGFQCGTYLTKAKYNELPDGVRRHIPLLKSEEKPSASLAEENKGGDNE